MRWIDHRRHSLRDPGAVHLNERGVQLADEVGRRLGPFDRVETSPAPRAVETALAMGCKVDATRADLATFTSAVESRLGPITGWADYDRAVRSSTVVADFAHRLAELLGAIAQALPDGGSALVISHGGVVELSAAGALSRPRWKPSGETASYLEGVRLGWDGRRFVEGQIERVARHDRSR